MFENGFDTFFLGQLILFMAVIVIFNSAYSLFSQRYKMAARLTGEDGDTHTSGSDLTLELDDGALKQYEKYLIPTSYKKRGAVSAALIKAGYRRPSAIRIFYATRISLSVAAIAISALLLPITMMQMPLSISLSTMFLMIIMGYFAPNFWVERKYQYRRMSIENEFPDALDLLLVCIEAGHSFDQALSRVVKEMSTSAEVLVDELSVVVLELRVGKDREKVLSDFGHRTGVDDVISFITVIKQADKYGVSIAEALRVYSSEMRDKRYMRGEEKANMMPVKLALGAVMFTVPPVIIILIGPSMLMVVRQLGGLSP